jgi:WD40 repeat protein
VTEEKSAMTTDFKAEACLSSSFFLDHVETPLNPCSVETISTPLTLDDGRHIWPVMVGCYELQQDSQIRKGHLDLYGIQVPISSDDALGSNNNDDGDDRRQLAFGSPHNIILGETTSTSSSATESSSGILDGKWYHNVNDDTRLWYATAHSSGEIKVHAVAVGVGDPSGGESNVARSPSGSTSSPFQVHLAGRSTSAGDDHDDEPIEIPGLCLSLSWETPTATEELLSRSNRIISSYSDGHVAIHNVAFHNDGTVQLEQEQSWLAHRMFTKPAEVWTACFVSTNNANTTNHDTTDLVMTGGDEGTFALWDLRCVGSLSSSSSSYSAPVHVIKDFEAGATVLSPHPRRDYLVACGSYDETVALYDIRFFSPSQIGGGTRRRRSPRICHSDAVGGGLWRIKWHPYDDDRLLLSAMHGGCRVVHSNGLLGKLDMENQDNDNSRNAGNSDEINIQVQKAFTAHKSMAYGADWLVYQPSTRTRASFDLAASCSFYDRALYLWDTGQ